MMIVTEDALGVFKVVLTDKHQDNIDASVKAIGCSPEAVLGMWIIAGGLEAAFVEADRQLSRLKYLDSLDDADDETF